MEGGGGGGGGRERRWEKRGKLWNKVKGQTDGQTTHDSSIMSLANPVYTYNLSTVNVFFGGWKLCGRPDRAAPNWSRTQAGFSVDDACHCSATLRTSMWLVQGNCWCYYYIVVLSNYRITSIIVIIITTIGASGEEGRARPQSVART